MAIFISVTLQEKPALKKVSLAEARRSAIQALLDAENRRQKEREEEARFWHRLDSYA